jgi:acyl-CoA thioesterase
MNSASLPPDHENRIRETLDNVPFAKLLGIELVSTAVGEAVLAMPLHEGLKQDSGVVHGGAIASLIDSATAVAIMTMLASGERVTTIDLTVSYLRPLTQGRAVASARVLRIGRRIISVSAEVHAQATTVAATALSTYLRL